MTAISSERSLFALDGRFLALNGNLSLRLLAVIGFVANL
jgi:hypothetical protein